MRPNPADLFGKTIGTWEVLEYLGSRVTAQRGNAAGLRLGAARRSFWRVRCVLCDREREFPTSYIKADRSCADCYRRALEVTKDEPKETE